MWAEAGDRTDRRSAAKQGAGLDNFQITTAEKGRPPGQRLITLQTSPGGQKNTPQ